MAYTVVDETTATLANVVADGPTGPTGPTPPSILEIMMPMLMMAMMMGMVVPMTRDLGEQQQ